MIHSLEDNADGFTGTSEIFCPPFSIHKLDEALQIMTGSFDSPMSKRRSREHGRKKHGKTWGRKVANSEQGLGKGSFFLEQFMHKRESKECHE